MAWKQGDSKCITTFPPCYIYICVPYVLCSVVAEEYHSSLQLYKKKAKEHTQTHAKKVTFADMAKVRERTPTVQMSVAPATHTHIHTHACTHARNILTSEFKSNALLNPRMRSLV